MASIMSRIGQAAVSGTSGAWNAVEGVTNVAVGGAVAVVGAGLDPALRQIGGTGTGALQEVTDRGVDLSFIGLDQDRLDAMERASRFQGWSDNPASRAGQTTFGMGVQDFNQMALDGGRAVALLAGQEEKADEFLDLSKQIGAENKEKTNLVSTLGGVLTGRSWIKGGAKLLAKQGGPAVINQLSEEDRKRQRDHELRIQKEMARQKTIDEAAELVDDYQVNIMRMRDSEGPIDAATSQMYAGILAGPDGWGSVGDWTLGNKAFSDHQAGNYQAVHDSWLAWRAAGGRWRNDP